MTLNETRRRKRRETSRHPGGDQFELKFDHALTRPERFEKFRQENPHFYVEIVALGRQYRRQTGRTCSIQGLMETVRANLEMKSRGSEEYKLNNDFGAYYARLIMLQEPDMEGFFELRRSDEADRWIAIRKHSRRVSA
ncbi:MAG: hypothetical protein M3460_11195 [Actinomycetota bacterium]|nr:hypothetical protein [Actinomycetota bacterium]